MGSSVGESNRRTSALAVGSPTEISRDFICNVTSYVSKIWLKSGEDGRLCLDGGSTSLGEDLETVRSWIAWYSAFILTLVCLWSYTSPDSRYRPK